MDAVEVWAGVASLIGDGSWGAVQGFVKERGLAPACSVLPLLQETLALSLCFYDYISILHCLWRLLSLPWQTSSRVLLQPCLHKHKYQIGQTVSYLCLHYLLYDSVGINIHSKNLHIEWISSAGMGKFLFIDETVSPSMASFVSHCPNHCITIVATTLVFICLWAKQSLAPVAHTTEPSGRTLVKGGRVCCFCLARRLLPSWSDFQVQYLGIQSNQMHLHTPGVKSLTSRELSVFYE